LSIDGYLWYLQISHDGHRLEIPLEKKPSAGIPRASSLAEISSYKQAATAPAMTAKAAGTAVAMAPAELLPAAEALEEADPEDPEAAGEVPELEAALLDPLPDPLERTPPTPPLPLGEDKVADLAALAKSL
jgi:hypothetical protein